MSKVMTSNLFYQDVCENISLNDTEFINNSALGDNENFKSEEKVTANLHTEDRSDEYNRNGLSATIKKVNTSISSWGLPDNILSKYECRGIRNMFKWQAECLGNHKVLIENRNLVYSAPTSAGKTLVAEILALKTVLEKQKKVIIILPFVSVVREKMFYFQDILSSSGIRVDGFMGSHSPPGGFKLVQVAICTIEKANGIVNKLLEEGSLSDVGAVIVDEIHLLADPSRGYLLELLLTKLLYMSAKDQTIDIQLIGMSATLPNLDLLAKWLDAELYTTDFRPIPLYEYSLVAGEMYDTKFHLQRRLNKLPELAEDSDNILQLCLETISISCSVLIFCPTKNWCENLAQQISVAFRKLGMSNSTFGKCLREQLSTDDIMEVLEQLQRCPVGLDTVLKRTVSFGVAFHHAGLTMDERDIIEGAFRGGALRVLVATSTLSSGVNLPARRVIIRTPLFHGKPLDILTYKQMIGRAGRMGKDSCGESVLVCQPIDKRIASDLLSAKLCPITSCLEAAGKLNRAVLEVIASGVASTAAHVLMFTKCTLLSASRRDQQHISEPVLDTVQFLLKNELIRLQRNDAAEPIYTATALGKACLTSSLSPEDGLILFEEIEKARQCFVLDTDLHLLYLVTPYSVCTQWTKLDWMFYLDTWEKLPTNMRRVGELVGVRESYIFNAAQGHHHVSTNSNTKQYHRLQIHRRFYTALALQDLVNEVPLNNVALKFQCSRGMLQSLQQSASMFAGMVTSFCNQLRWKCVEILVSQFQDRLHFGIQHELLDLMKLPVMNGPRARALYDAGIHALTDLASVDISRLENILEASVPFQSEKLDDANKKNMRTIWISGKEGLTARQAAQMFVKDARNYLQFEMGAVAVKWEESIGRNLHSSNSYSNSISSRNSSTSNKMDSLVSKFNQHSIISKNDDRDELESLSTHGKQETNTNLTDSDIFFEWSLSLQEKSPSHNSTPIVTARNSDLFEESLNLNSRLCDVLDKALTDKTVPNLQKCNNKFDNYTQVNDTLIAYASDNEFFISKTSEIDDNSPNIIDTSISETKDSFKFFKTISSVRKKKSKKLRRKRSRNKQNNSQETPTKKRKWNTSNNDSVCISLDENIFDLSATELSIAEGSHMPEKTEPVDPVVLVDMSHLDIVPVSNNTHLFQVFCLEVDNIRTISLAVACDPIQTKSLTIGKNIIKCSHIQHNESDEKTHSVYENKHITGVSLCWGGNTAYYISFTEQTCQLRKKLDILQNILNKRHVVIQMFDSKEQIKALYYGCGISVNCKIQDPKVADWLLQPDAKEKNLQAMASKYAAAAVVGITQMGGSNSKGKGSISLDVHSSILSRIRSGAESVAVWHIVNSQKQHILNQNVTLMDTFEMEMSTILILARMEITGVGIYREKMNKIIDKIQEHMKLLEKQAYQLAGRRFSFSSSKEVAMVLGMYKGRRVSTSKKTLEHHLNPISDIIIQWRKLNSTLTKMLYPLSRSQRNNRIHGCYITLSATGRISMHEPNLQNVPRNFEIDKSNKSAAVLSVRSVFVPTKDKLFLSADYCQLELRILAHLSCDLSLLNALTANSDVFKQIASKLNKLPVEQVNDVQRQHAKQLCYGVIYGMGTKALSLQMGTDEQEAITFMSIFSTTYPCVQKFIQRTVASCRKVGYVETVAGRRRYLPNINSNQTALRGQAERQAVNTTVQGSAADIAKRAMIQVEESLGQHYYFRQSSSCTTSLVLHLHDELLYEVPFTYLNTAATLIKHAMETATKLTIPLPVKLKYGSSWGQLQDFPV